MKLDLTCAVVSSKDIPQILLNASKTLLMSVGFAG